MKERAAHLTSGIETPSRSISDFGIAADGSSSKETTTPPAAADLFADNGDGDCYLDGHKHSESSNESANQAFEYGGEQEELKEAREKPEKDQQKNEGRPEEGEGIACRETLQDIADEVKEKRAALGGTTTHRCATSENCRPQQTSQDTLAEPPTPGGSVAQVSVESPQDEDVQHASAAALSQQQPCSEAKGEGEEHEPMQAPHSAMVPAGSNTERASSTRIADSDTEQVLSSTVPRTAATGEPSAAIEIQAAPGYNRRPSYVPGQAMRPARSAARASIQLSLPPIIAGSGPATGSKRAASNDRATKVAHTAAEAEPGESVESPAKDQSWAEYHELNARRQHSTPNLVSFRRNFRQLSIELFEEGDSDDTSTSRRSSGAIDQEDANVEERPNKFDDHVSWQHSEEGKSRIAQLTKATVAIESRATKMSRKYLKLFAPSNSVRLALRACFSYAVLLLCCCSLSKEQPCNSPQGKHDLTLPTLVLSSFSLAPVQSLYRRCCRYIWCRLVGRAQKRGGKPFLAQSCCGAQTASPCR